MKVFYAWIGQIVLETAGLARSALSKSRRSYTYHPTDSSTLKFAVGLESLSLFVDFPSSRRCSDEFTRFGSIAGRAAYHSSAGCIGGRWLGLVCGSDVPHSAVWILAGDLRRGNGIRLADGSSGCCGAA